MASSIANCFCLKSMPLNKDWNHSQRNTIVRNTTTKELHFLHKNIQNNKINDFCWEHWNNSTQYKSRAHFLLDEISLELFHLKNPMNSAGNNYKIAKHNNGLDKYTKP